MKCSNCSANAIYCVNDEGVSTVYYCNACLPKGLQARANAGQLDLPKEPTQTKKKAAAKESEPTEATDENPTA